MTKALLDPRPEKRNPNAMELFTINKQEISQFPEIFLHKFEFLEPLLMCYEEKISRLEQIVDKKYDKYDKFLKTEFRGT